ncbi:TPA: hypothetical protein ACPJ01_004462 [Vibrio diabolicus]
MLNWSSQNSLAKSKMVKSSGIWFVLVPIVAQLLEGFDGALPIIINSKTYELTLVLPFSWQLLFFAAFFFMVAGIIYQVRCSDIVKLYTSYSQFKLEGNSRLQVNQHLKRIVWDDKNGVIFKDYKNVINTYLSNYSSCSINKLKSDVDYLNVLDDLSISTGQDGNAFYFVYNVSDKDGQRWIMASSVSYILGFICLFIIVVLNFIFVVKSFG